MRISKRNSTGNASWGGPQHREFRKEILQTMQVGDDKEIFFSLSHYVSLTFQNTKVTSLVYQNFCYNKL